MNKSNIVELVEEQKKITAAKNKKNMKHFEDVDSKLHSHTEDIQSAMHQEHCMYQTMFQHSTNQLWHHSTKGHHDTLRTPWYLISLNHPTF